VGIAGCPYLPVALVGVDQGFQCPDGYSVLQCAGNPGREGGEVHQGLGAGGPVSLAGVLSLSVNERVRERAGGGVWVWRAWTLLLVASRSSTCDRVMGDGGIVGSTRLDSAAEAAEAQEGVRIIACVTVSEMGASVKKTCLIPTYSLLTLKIRGIRCSKME